MPHLLTQLQQKLQLDCKTIITQNFQKIKLYGSLTTKDLRSHIHPDMYGDEAENQINDLKHKEEKSIQSEQ